MVFMTFKFDPDISKVKFLAFVTQNICTKFHEHWTCSFLEITTSITNKQMNQPTNLMNEPTNQQTRVITIPPGGGN